jgi:hypothetical protein
LLKRFIWKATPLRDWTIVRLICKKFAFIIWCRSLLSKIVLDANAGISSKIADCQRIFNGSPISYSDNMRCFSINSGQAILKQNLVFHLLLANYRNSVTDIRNQITNPFVFENGMRWIKADQQPGLSPIIQFSHPVEAAIYKGVKFDARHLVMTVTMLFILFWCLEIGKRLSLPPKPNSRVRRSDWHQQILSAQLRGDQWFKQLNLPESTQNWPIAISPFAQMFTLGTSKDCQPRQYSRPVRFLRKGLTSICALGTYSMHDCQCPTVTNCHNPFQKRNAQQALQYICFVRFCRC